jgi:hypothetical protein
VPSRFKRTSRGLSTILAALQFAVRLGDLIYFGIYTWSTSLVDAGCLCLRDAFHGRRTIPRFS